MDVRMRCKTGWPSNTKLRSSVSAYTRLDRCDGYKIGITSDPRRRASQYPYGYDEMVVLYETLSIKHVRDTERFLITAYWDDCDNSIRGGNGRPGSPPYYLYVVLSHR